MKIGYQSHSIKMRNFMVKEAILHDVLRNSKIKPNNQLYHKVMMFWKVEFLADFLTLRFKSDLLWEFNQIKKPKTFKLESTKISENGKTKLWRQQSVRFYILTDNRNTKFNKNTFQDKPAANSQFNNYSQGTKYQERNSNPTSNQFNPTT